MISPSALLSAVEQANKTKSQAGYGDLYELARAGRSSLVDNVPNSGSAQRALVNNLLTGGAVGGSLGLGTLVDTGGDLEAASKAALVGSTGAYALPKAVQSFINSPSGRNYIMNGLPTLERLIGTTGPANSAASASIMAGQPDYSPITNLPAGLKAVMVQRRVNMRS